MNTKTGNFECIIFDLDGVIHDSIKALNEAYEKTMLEYLKKSINLTREELTKSPLDILSVIPVNLRDEALSYFNKRYLKLLDTPNFYPGIKEIISELYVANKNIVLITSQPKDRTERILMKGSLGKFFDKVFTWRDTYGKKSKRQETVINRLILEYDILPINIAYVTDNPTDILCARNTGIKSIGVAWGLYSMRKIELCNPDYFVLNIKSLRSLLE